jgi:hypothetical protein
MNAKQRLGKWVGLMLIAGILMAAVVGCLKVNANTDVKLDGDEKRVRYSNRKVKKSDAYDIAKSIARDAGVNPKDYDIHDKKIDDTYWVLFERYKKRGKLGWENHFAVRVSPSGRGKLYK